MVASVGVEPTRIAPPNFEFGMSSGSIMRPKWSRCRDLNPGSPEPKSGALPNFATSRYNQSAQWPFSTGNLSHPLLQVGLSKAIRLNSAMCLIIAPNYSKVGTNRIRIISRDPIVSHLPLKRDSKVPAANTAFLESDLYLPMDFRSLSNGLIIPMSLIDSKRNAYKNRKV